MDRLIKVLQHLVSSLTSLVVQFCFIFKQFIQVNALYLLMGNRCCQDDQNSPRLPPRRSNSKATTSVLKVKKCEFTNVNEIFDGLREELNKNHELYNTFMNVCYIEEVMNMINITYLSKQAITNILSLIIDFFAYCRHPLQSWKGPLTDQYYEQMAVRWAKIRNENFNENKGHLRILNFIVEKPKSGDHFYGSCFQQLAFDLSEKECKRVAQVSRKMSKEDTRAFCYLSNYILISCQRLQQKGFHLQEITTKYDERIAKLSQHYRPAPEIKGENSQLDMHKTFKKEELFPDIGVTLKSSGDSEQILDDFIMERAQKAAKHFQRFYKLMSSVCDEHQGFRFKANLKIEQRSQTKALLRIKQKMLASYFKTIELQPQLGVTQSGLSSSTIKDSVRQQQQAYLLKIGKIFKSVEGRIPFKVDDMLRGKCLFADVNNINACCSSILAVLETEQNRDLRVFQIKNRLRLGTSDLVIRVLFGDVIAEMQLAINLNAAEYDFNHKIYQLTRTTFFTSLAQLTILNDKVSSDYLTEVKEIIKANCRPSQVNFHENISYQEAEENFENFVSLLPLNLNLQTTKAPFDINFLRSEVVKFQELLKEDGSHLIGFLKPYETRLREGIFLTSINELVRARQVFEMGLKELQQKQSAERTQEMERVRSDLHKNWGLVSYHQGRYQQAIEHESRSLQIQYKMGHKNYQQICTLINNLGCIYQRKGDYDKALEYLLKTLDVQKEIEGEEGLSSYKVVNNIANTYVLKGQYQQSLQYYNKAISILANFHKSHDIEMTNALIGLGGAYNGLHNYSKAIECFEKCLEIQQKIQGKGCIDSAITLINIGMIKENQEEYQKALEYFQRAFQIQTQFDTTIDMTKTLRQIGKIHLTLADYPKALSAFQQLLQIEGNASPIVNSTVVKIGKGNDVLTNPNTLTILEGEKGSLNIVQTLLTIGIIYNSLNQNQQAHQYGLKALRMHEKLEGKEKGDSINSLNTLGKCYQLLGDSQKELDCLKKCQVLLKSQGKGKESSSKQLSDVYNRIGMTYRNLEKYGEAKQAYFSALKIIGEENAGSAPLLTNLGNVSYLEQNFQQCQKYYLKSLAIYERCQQQNLAGDVVMKLCGCYLKFGKIDKLQQIVSKYQLM